MRAVREPASLRGLFHVPESLPERFIGAPKLQLTYPRRVDEHSALGQKDQLARGGRVSAPVVGGADLAHLLALFAQEPVHEGRFAHSGWAEQHRGLSRTEIRGKLAE